MNKKGIVGIVILFAIGIFTGFKVSGRDIAQRVNLGTTEKVEQEEQKTIDIKLKDSFTVEVNTKLPDVSEYFDEYVENDYQIKYLLSEEEVSADKVISSVGTYNVEITLNNEKYDTKLIVNDTIKPELKVKNVTITSGDKYNINSFIDSCKDNSNESCKLSVSDDSMLKYTKSGSYDIKVLATDSSNNETASTAKLTIKAKEVKKQVKSEKTVKSAKKENTQTVKTTSVKTTSNSKYKTSKQLESQASKLVSQNKKEANEILKYTNSYRKAKGVSNLVLDDKLSVVANIRAIEVAIYDKFAHTRPNGTSFSTVVSELNIKVKIVGENLAEGQISSEEVCSDWKASSSHYANMVRPEFNKMGVGVYTYNGITYWVQIFSN